MADRIVSPGSEISLDTHVGGEFEHVPAGVVAAASPAHPNALIEGNRVSTGDELELD